MAAASGKTPKRPRQTPMQEQYARMRERVGPDTLLFFRLGDFYELFGADAEKAAPILNITLTRRHDQPMAGVPYHAAPGYLEKLLAAGLKVALCDQVETPRPGQLVEREITRILTPGTALEDGQLDPERNQYLAALHPDGDGLAAAWLDLSTGDFWIAREADASILFDTLLTRDPRELVLAESWRQAPFADAILWEQLRKGRSISAVPAEDFSQREGAARVVETLGLHSLDGLGIAADHPALGAAGALLTYCAEQLCAPPQHLRHLRELRSAATLVIDATTARHLELFEASTGSGATATGRARREGSLRWAIDRTVTAPGARLLEAWLAAPLRDLEVIAARQARVGALHRDPARAEDLRGLLKPVRDLPRILARLRNRVRHPRELGSLLDSLRQLPAIHQMLEQFGDPELEPLGAALQTFPELTALLEQALAADLPARLGDSPLIAEHFDAELDRLRALTRDSQQWIHERQRAEAEATGIKTLKIKFNNAFGYFIEVTKANLHRVPEHYLRKQTTVNAERFVTPELKEKEQEILQAEDRAAARETELFGELVEQVLGYAEALADTAQTLAELDVLSGWAALAHERDYCRPQVDPGRALEIEQGRHPVVEAMLERERRENDRSLSGFVPNDTRLDAQDEQIALITGPNMAGKSTYIRQVALLTLMAQCGCWVPAQRMRLGLVDRVFSRVGASDELARGNSTFMVEMNETARILHQATQSSLVILDEIGRGTSTYDGLSIAWAVVEHLHGTADTGPRTLFATHYHELTQLERQLSRVCNYRVSVREHDGRILFLRRVERGAADRSYGIQVARLAGLPESVILRAQDILHKLEADDSSHNLLRERMRIAQRAAERGEDDQLELL